jgi:hypothetical protein
MDGVCWLGGRDKWRLFFVVRNLTGSTGVTFNGTTVTFTVVAATERRPPYYRGYHRDNRGHDTRR